MKNERILPQLNTALWACSLGTVLEWYDFFIFAVIAPTLSVQFFPATNTEVALLYTLMAFATSYISRPIGGIIFGHIGDKLGRKPSLLASMTLMGVSSTAMIFAPTYAMMGVGASVFVFVIRIVQGIALGGEYGGAATYVAEQSNPTSRALQTAYLQTASSFGFVFALAIIMLLRSTMGIAEFDAWGWRITFSFSLLWIIPSYCIRKNLMETKIFQSIKDKKMNFSAPIRVLLVNKQYLKIVLVSIIGLTMGQAISSYSGFFSMFFLHSYHTIDSSDIDFILLVSSIFVTPAIIWAGYMADKTSYKHVILAGMLLCILFYIPIFDTMDFIARHHTKGISLSWQEKGILLMVLCFQKLFFSMVYAPLIAQLTIMFPAKLRYSGISLSYNVGNGLFGGTYLPLASYLAIHPIFTTSYYDALLYPMFMLSICFCVAWYYLPRNNSEKMTE